jgi:hypothetical protein
VSSGSARGAAAPPSAHLHGREVRFAHAHNEDAQRQLCRVHYGPDGIVHVVDDAVRDDEQHIVRLRVGRRQRPGGVLAGGVDDRGEQGGARQRHRMKGRRVGRQNAANTVSLQQMGGRGFVRGAGTGY